jgi:uncharacterized membrane protein
MSTLTSNEAPVPEAVVRRITTADLRWALAEGWSDFKEKRGDVLFIGVIYPLVGFFAAMVALNGQLLPLFFPLVAGLALLGPAVSSGFYELARRREEGVDSSWWHFLDPLRGPNRQALATLTAVLLCLFVAWLAVAWAIYGATLGRLHPAGVSDFMHDLFRTQQGWTLIILGNLAGLGFALVAFMLSLVSFPMVVDKPVDAATAMRTSIRAVQANPRIIAGWGSRVAGLLILGTVPAFVGLALVLPVLGYATWHLYTRLVQR